MLRKTVLSICLSVTVFLTADTLAESVSVSESWVYKAGETVGESPKFYPNAFNPTHVVVVSGDGIVSLVDGNGEAVWTTDSGGNCAASAGIGNLDDDNHAEIVVGLHDGDVVALDENGHEMWRYKMAGKIANYRCPMLIDLNDDGRCEVVATDCYGYVVCLSPRGKRLWRFRIDKYYASATAAADLDRDGEIEIVYGTENDRVVCLTADGQLKWTQRIEGKFGRTAPSLGDMNGDGYLDVAVTMSFNTPNGKLYVLSGPTGDLLWAGPIEMWAYASNSVVDLDRDGSMEVICCGRARRVHVFNSDGTLRWKKKIELNGFYRECSVADVNGDGRYELLNGKRFGPGFEILGDNGEHLGYYASEECHVTPLVGDVDHDGKLEILTAKIQKGELLCFDTEAPATENAVLWPSYRRDSANTGVGEFPQPAEKAYPLEMEDKKLDVKVNRPIVWGINEAVIEWPSSMPENALLDISVISEKGSTETTVVKLKRIALSSFVSFHVAYRGRNTVVFDLRDDKDGHLLASRELRTKNSGLKSLEQWTKPTLDRSIALSENLAGRETRTSLYLRQRVTDLQAGLQSIEDFMQSDVADTDEGRDRLLQHINDFRKEARNHTTLVDVLDSIPADESIPPILIWVDPNPWDEESPWVDLSHENANSNEPLSTWMYKNEYEDVALNLLNITPDPLTVQVRGETADLEHIDVREAISVPRQDGTWVVDALPELNSAHTISLSPGETRQLWFVCNSNGVDAGIHEWNLDLLVLGHKDTTLPVTLKTEVVDIDLDDTPPFMLCNWSSLGRLESAGFSGEVLQESIEYGMNVLYISMPSGECNENGDLIGEPDWSRTDRELSLLTPDCFLFVSVHVRTPKGIQKGSPVWRKAYRAWAEQVMAHLEERGFPPTHWAIYPVDEPGLYDGPRIEQFMDVVTDVREAAPEVPIYANPAGAIRKENFTPLLPYVDVWCPELGTLLRRPWMQGFFLDDEGAQVWCYEAPGWSKHLRPLGFYRSQPLIAFSIGLTGAGYWVHFYSDLWRSDSGAEYGANYGTAGIWVESRRWHATRDGTEDARALRLLRGLLEEAERREKESPVCERARRLLREVLPEALEPPKSADDVTRHVVEDYDPDLSKLMEIRRQTAELTIELRRIVDESN